LSLKIEQDTDLVPKVDIYFVLLLDNFEQVQTSCQHLLMADLASPRQSS